MTIRVYGPVRQVPRETQNTKTRILLDSNEFGVSHYFKQYYRDNKGTPCKNGVLDGVCRQEFPNR